MPEGHTLHRLADRYTDLLVGHRVEASSPQGRFAAGAATIDGRQVTGVDAYGKHLLASFDGLADRLHVHLGLYGTFADGPRPEPPVRGALRLRLLTDYHWVDLRGPTACELMSPPDVERLLGRLGPDPLRRDAAARRGGQTLVARLARLRGPVGAALMDQSVLAGVGNVYRAEVLFRHRINPFRPARDVDADVAEAVWDDLRVLMRAGVRAGRILTTRPEHRDRRRGPATREDAYYVYRRTGLPCRICGTPVTTDVLVGRNVYWCPCCQVE